ncbi:hypothetical protein [Haladaptatus sp. DYF46]|uniref:hypothetical protein n=1 Tax=Haladaptatus sp. DYF46 TaxID=2886041 RepID=UPI001E2F6C95|nr:hypothetical protein [Haladaptatus sp. DYF46]
MTEATGEKRGDGRTADTSEVRWAAWHETETVFPVGELPSGMATGTRSRTSKAKATTGDLLAVAATILLANLPTLFAFYVILDTYDPLTTDLTFLQYATTTMSGALVFAVLWTGIVFFAYGPSLSRRWNDR